MYRFSDREAGPGRGRGRQEELQLLVQHDFLEKPQGQPPLVLGLHEAEEEPVHPRPEGVVLHGPALPVHAHQRHVVRHLAGQTRHRCPQVRTVRPQP